MIYCWLCGTIKLTNTCQNTHIYMMVRTLQDIAAEPTVWNSLPDSLCDMALGSNSFRQSLKTNLFRRHHSAQSHEASLLRCVCWVSTHSAVEMLHDSVRYKSILTLTLTLCSADTDSVNFRCHGFVWWRSMLCSSHNWNWLINNSSHNWHILVVCYMVG